MFNPNNSNRRFSRAELFELFGVNPDLEFVSMIEND